jgi:hypothetical protein
MPARKDGGAILDWEEWEDETPFDDIPCNPMPHRWEAQSIADETMDVQQIKTVLLRQALDNTYATNNPQRFVKGKIKTRKSCFPRHSAALSSVSPARPLPAHRSHSLPIMPMTRSTTWIRS